MLAVLSERGGNLTLLNTLPIQKIGTHAPTPFSVSFRSQDPSPPQVSRNHGGVDGPSVLFTHRSDMWAAGVVVLELYAGGLSALTAGRGENASDLLETLVSNTASVMTEASAENGGVPGKQTKDKGVPSAFAKDGKSAESGAADGAGKRPTKGKGCTKNRNTFRVDMPAGVLAILREIFQWEAGDRPVSVEVVFKNMYMCVCVKCDDCLSSAMHALQASRE